MSSDFREAFKNISQSIIGIGLNDKSGFHIFGTGFLVDSTGWIMTNRHVLEPLLENQNSIKTQATAFLFVRGEINGGNFKTAGVRAVQIWQIRFPENKIKTPQHPFPTLPGYEPGRLLQPEPADIGFCRIKISDCPQDTLPLKPVAIIDSRDTTEGTPVGFLGFPQGLDVPLQCESTTAIQLTPLLQTGVIAGMLPYSGLPKPDAFVLDTYINGGSSGSPLFGTDGKVVGIVYATRLHFSPLTAVDNIGRQVESTNMGVYLPSSLGLAVPSARFIEEVSVLSNEHPTKTPATPA